MQPLSDVYNLPLMASGEKTQARHILAAIRALSHIEQEQRPATPDERERLSRFAGFGKVALSLFPNPVTGRYKDESWQELGEELRALLSDAEYDSAKRTTFTAFYTSPIVVQAMHEALAHLGVPANATVLEPGCGSGRFMSQAPKAMRFIGIELDSLSGRIARALHPGHDIRIENFRDTRLPENRIDAVLGNVPFADIRLDYSGQKLALHDFFMAKSLDTLKPGGILALITSHYTLDKQNAALREHLASRADFLGAIRLPSDAFKQEGTRVVTDILFLHKREADQAPRHAHDGWLETATLKLEGADIPVNRYFLEHPEMVLGVWSREHRLYGSEFAYSVTGIGDLAAKLRAAAQHLPRGVFSGTVDPGRAPPDAAPFTPPPALAHIDEGSFVVAENQTLMQVQAGEAVPVTHGDKPLTAGGTMMGKHLAALIALRDQARRVLQSQNEDWPEAHRHEARRSLNRFYDRFVATYGPVNKTTLSVTAKNTTVRRMPNLVKFRDDPDAMLVMSLEHYDEATGTAEKAAIMHQDVVGRSPPVTAVESAEDGLLICLDQLGKVDLPYIEKLYQAPCPGS
jgi:hypothetical protein